MKTKHTPGPWHSSTYRYDSDYELIWDKSDRIICQMYDRFEDFFTNYKANAKLIIAAPDLLEALNELMPFVSEWINDNHPAMIKAKQAIKKATE